MTMTQKVGFLAGVISEMFGCSRLADSLVMPACEPNTYALLGDKLASYQNAPLSEYQQEHQSLAEELFAAASARLGPSQFRRWKGSYSFYGLHGKDTLAKIIIFERAHGKVNGDWPIDRDGVYVLFRVYGATEAPTIGVAPAHAERFTYERVEPGDVASAVDRIVVAVSAGHSGAASI